MEVKSCNNCKNKAAYRSNPEKCVTIGCHDLSKWKGEDKMKRMQFEDEEQLEVFLRDTFPLLHRITGGFKSDTLNIPKTISNFKEKGYLKQSELEISIDFTEAEIKNMNTYFEENYDKGKIFYSVRDKIFQKARSLKSGLEKAQLEYDRDSTTTPRAHNLIKELKKEIERLKNKGGL